MKVQIDFKNLPWCEETASRVASHIKQVFKSDSAQAPRLFKAVLSLHGKAKSKSEAFQVKLRAYGGPFHRLAIFRTSDQLTGAIEHAMHELNHRLDFRRLACRSII